MFLVFVGIVSRQTINLKILNNAKTNNIFRASEMFKFKPANRISKAKQTSIVKFIERCLTNIEDRSLTSKIEVCLTVN